MPESLQSTMKKHKITIFILCSLLLASNAFWVMILLLMTMLDTGIGDTYSELSLEYNSQALAQTLTVVELLSSEKDSKPEILAALKDQHDLDFSFDKDGLTWIGKIGLKFNEQNRLQYIERSWSDSQHPWRHERAE